MEFISFILAIIVNLLIAVLLGNSIVTSSPMQGLAITLQSIMLLLASLGTVISYKELKKSRYEKQD